MPYCKTCGVEIPEGSRFCPSCGAPVRIGLNLSLDRNGFWIPRIMAYIIDTFIIGLAVIIIPIILAIPLMFTPESFTPRFFLSLPSLISGLISVIYFTLMDYFFGSTIGKRLLRIRVTTVKGGLPTFEMAFIRNASKIHGVLLSVDIIAGLLTLGNSSQKLSDRYAGTVLQREDYSKSRFSQTI